MDHYLIENGFTYIALLMFTAGTLKFLEVKTHWKFFDYIPAVVCLYLVAMFYGTFHLWDANSPAIKATASAFKDHLTPAMLFLILLKANLKQILRMGWRLLFTFYLGAFSIAIGFFVTYVIFQKQLNYQWGSLAALCGSWIGGGNNMVAIQKALDIPDSAMAAPLLMDTVYYSLWLMLALWLLPSVKKINLWTKADAGKLDTITAQFEEEHRQHNAKGISFTDMIFLCGLGLAASAVCQYLATMLPATSIISEGTWTVILVTVFALIFAMTPIGKMPGSLELSNSMLYLLIAILGAAVDLRIIADAAFFILVGIFVLAIHAFIMVFGAKLFKLDFFSCILSSLANIGGVASATVISAAYAPAMIPVGVLMAMLGFISGSIMGIMLGRLMELCTF